MTDITLTVFCKRCNLEHSITLPLIAVEGMPVTPTPQLLAQACPLNNPPEARNE